MIPHVPTLSFRLDVVRRFGRKRFQILGVTKLPFRIPLVVPSAIMVFSYNVSLRDDIVVFEPRGVISALSTFSLISSTVGDLSDREGINHMVGIGLRRSVEVRRQPVAKKTKTSFIILPRTARGSCVFAGADDSLSISRIRGFHYH